MGQIQVSSLERCPFFGGSLYTSLGVYTAGTLGTVLIREAFKMSSISGSTALIVAGGKTTHAVAMLGGYVRNIRITKYPT